MNNEDKKNKGGRPRAQVVPMPVFDNMAACEGATGIPKKLQQEAKAAGCDAFSSNRVYLDRLLRWIFSKGNGGEDDDGVVADWSKELAKVKTLREEIKLEIDRGNVVARADVQQHCQTALAILFGELDKTFGTELPAALQGKTANEIRFESVKAIESMKERLKILFDKAAEGSQGKDTP